MATYIILTLFVMSSTVILYYLDHMKMKLARNLFMVFMWSMFVIIPITINSELYVKVEDAVISNMPFGMNLMQVLSSIDDDAIRIVYVVILITAAITLIATAILVIRAAILITRLVEFSKARHNLYVTVKKHMKRVTRFSYSPDGRRIYIRFCRLLN